MKNAIAANWVAETCEDTFTGFRLKGTSKGYTTFKKAFSAGNQVFYSAHDGNGNREAGYATFNGSDLIDRHATASLVNGVYQDKTPGKVRFTGDVTVACTFNAVEFNTLWKVLDEIGHDGDGGINIPPELIDGLVVALDHKAEQSDLDAEIAARKAGDDDLQDQIDNINVSGGGASTWDELTNKPTEFPPESHNHEINDVNGLQDALDAAGGTPAWDDVTGKPTEFPPEAHTHEQSEVDGLEDRLTSIEGSISSGGGFVDAPDDGKLYGRQSESWAEVEIPDQVDPDWADVQNKPVEFPPESHKHPTSDVNGLDDALSDIADDISDLDGAVGALAGQLAFGGSYDASTGLVVKANLAGYTAGQPLPSYDTVPNTFVIVSAAGDNPEEVDEGDWLVAGDSAWVPINYGTAGTVDWSNIENIPDFDSIYAELDHGHEEITKDSAYIKYVVDKWVASPSLSVTGDLDVGGDTSLSGGISVDGDIEASGSISLDGDLSIGGQIDGDLSVSGNITIDGGQIVGPDGKPAGGGSPVHIGDTAPSDPAEGDLWYDASSDNLFLFDGAAWFSTESCGSGGGSGGIEEAPEDGIQYARKDAAWEPVEAFDDTQISADLAKEVADRKAGDLALQSQIEAGDLALQGEIEAGDLALQGQIDALGSGGGGGWELLATVEAASSSTVELSQFSDEFDDYKIIVSDVICGGLTPLVTKAQFHMQVAINGSYKTAGYGFHVDTSSANSSSYAGGAGKNASSVQLFADIDDKITILNSIEISAFGANNPSGAKTFFWHGMYYYNTGYVSVGGGYQTDVGKLTGIRFLMDNGNVDKGTFKLYGIKK